MGNDLESKCKEFKAIFETSIDGLQAALKILEEIEAEKRQRYAQATGQAIGSYTVLQAARNLSPNPWANVRKADTRLIRLLEAWAGNTIPRAESYRPPDVFGPPPKSEPEVGPKKEVPKPGLTEILEKFFKRPG